LVNTAACLHIAKQGEGPLIALAQDWLELWYSWRHILPALTAAGYHAVAPYMRGYGQTDAPPDIQDYILPRSRWPRNRITARRNECHVSEQSQPRHTGPAWFWLRPDAPGFPAFFANGRWAHSSRRLKSLAEANAVKQILEPRVGAQRVEGWPHENSRI